MTRKGRRYCGSSSSRAHPKCKEGSAEAILASAKPVAQRADKPEKRHAGKRHNIQRNDDMGHAIFQPCTRFMGIGRHREPHQPVYGQQQHGKQDARYRGSPRGPQLRVSQFGLIAGHGEMPGGPHWLNHTLLAGLWI